MAEELYAGGSDGELRVSTTGLPGSEVRICVEIAGQLNAHTAPSFRTTLNSVLVQQPSKVMVDLDRVTHLDSSGVGALVSLFKQVRSKGGTMVVAGARGQPLAVLKLLKLDVVFGN